MRATTGAGISLEIFQMMNKSFTLKKNMKRAGYYITLIGLISLLITACPSSDDTQEFDLSLLGLASLTFTDNGDGSVLDNNTQLTWMKCAAGQVWTGLNDCGGTGGDSTHGATSYQFCAAVLDYSLTECTDTSVILPTAIEGPAYVACSSETISGGGWRLPTRIELELLAKLVDYSTFNTVFPQNPEDKGFWSSTAQENTTDGNEAYGILLTSTSYAEVNLYHKANSNLYVRCVK